MRCPNSEGALLRSPLHGRMAPARRDCGGWEMILPAGWLLLSALLLHPTLAKVCNDRTKHGQDNSWFARDGENLPIMVLMPMNESALMSSISQGIEPAVQLAIKHIRETRKYSFSLITKIYDTEVTHRFSAHLVRVGRSPLAGMSVRRARALPDWGQGRGEAGAEGGRLYRPYV